MPGRSPWPARSGPRPLGCCSRRPTCPATDVAFAAGFASVRQFNATMVEIFATTPDRPARPAARARRAHAGRARAAAGLPRADGLGADAGLPRPPRHPRRRGLRRRRPCARTLRLPGGSAVVELSDGWPGLSSAAGSSSPTSATWSRPSRACGGCSTSTPTRWPSTRRWPRIRRSRRLSTPGPDCGRRAPSTASSWRSGRSSASRSRSAAPERCWAGSGHRSRRRRVRRAAGRRSRRRHVRRARSRAVADAAGDGVRPSSRWPGRSPSGALVLDPGADRHADPRSNCWRLPASARGRPTTWPCGLSPTPTSCLRATWASPSRPRRSASSSPMDNQRGRLGARTPPTTCGRPTHEEYRTDEIQPDRLTAGRPAGRPRRRGHHRALPAHRQERHAPGPDLDP